MICQVPKFAPYLTVLRTSRYEIEFNITDINPGNQTHTHFNEAIRLIADLFETIQGHQVEGYTVYYWGFRLGPKSSYRSEDRHFGHRNFTKGKIRE